MDPDAIIERLAASEQRRDTMYALADEAPARDVAAARERARDPQLRELLTVVLGEQADRGDATALAGLVAALEDAAGKVRGTAADQLGGALLFAEREGRPAPLGALAPAGDPPSEAAARAVLGDPPPEAAARAAPGDPPSEAAARAALGARLLTAFTAERDDGARASIAVALGGLAHAPARDTLRAAFRAAPEPGRQAYGWALERLGDPPGDRAYGGTWRGSYADLAGELLVLLAVDPQDDVVWDFPEEVHRLALARATDPAVRSALTAALDDD